MLSTPLPALDLTKLMADTCMLQLHTCCVCMPAAAPFPRCCLPVGGPHRVASRVWPPPCMLPASWQATISYMLAGPSRSVAEHAPIPYMLVSSRRPWTPALPLPLPLPLPLNFLCLCCCGAAGPCSAHGSRCICSRSCDSYDPMASWIPQFDFVVCGHMHTQAF